MGGTLKRGALEGVRIRSAHGLAHRGLVMDIRGGSLPGTLERLLVKVESSILRYICIYNVPPYCLLFNVKHMICVVCGVYNEPATSVLLYSFYFSPPTECNARIQ